MKRKNKLFKMYLKDPYDTNKAQYRVHKNKLIHIIILYFSYKFKEVQHDINGTCMVGYKKFIE